MIKEIIGASLGRVLFKSLLREKTVVFGLHRVVKEQDYNDCTFQKSTLITENSFITFLQWLKKEFEIVPLSWLINNEKQKHLNSEKPQAVITFDDGWRDNYDLAFPILKQEEIPATIFLSVNYIGSHLGFWWHGIGTLFTDKKLSATCKQQILQHLHRNLEKKDVDFDVFSQVDRFIELLKKEYPNRAEQITHEVYEICGRKRSPNGLTWEQCETMSEYGIEFGSHTLSHPMLSSLSDDKLSFELTHSKSLLLEKKVNYIDAVCYPFGGYDNRTLSLAKKYYSIGLTTGFGVVSGELSGRMDLPRINVSEKVNSDRLHAQYRLLKAVVNSIRKR